jgi:hypothetical protein
MFSARSTHNPASLATAVNADTTAPCCLSAFASFAASAKRSIIVSTVFTPRACALACGPHLCVEPEAPFVELSRTLLDRDRAFLGVTGRNGMLLNCTKIGHPFALASQAVLRDKIGNVLAALAQQLALGIAEVSPSHLFSPLNAAGKHPLRNLSAFGSEGRCSCRERLPRRAFLNSSYSGVPGRGGRFFGGPPAHWGM